MQSGLEPRVRRSAALPRAWRRCLIGVTTTVALSLGSGCTGSANADNQSGRGGEGGATPTQPGTTDPGSGTKPLCTASVTKRISRLPDRHIAHAIRDLLDLSSTPVLHTDTGHPDAFLTNKAASLTTDVALQLREVVEAAAIEATAAGKPAVTCSMQDAACAADFIDSFAPRAFRRPLTTTERDGLLAVYASGKTIDGTHESGIRLVIEATLQSPSFLYLTELGDAPQGTALTSYEIAAKMAFFLEDTLPDDELWAAAEQDVLQSPEVLSAQVERMLQKPSVKANISRMITRLFHFEGLADVTKAESVEGFSPALIASLQEETRRYVDAVLWDGTATFPELLTSRRAFVDPALAAIYGVDHPGGTGFAEVTLPAGQRSGLLTRAPFLTMEALPEESSVVHRGVFVTRELLCFHPGSPLPGDLAAGAMLKELEPTERGRAERRMEMARCAGCHAYFDPLGVPFENYDTLGRYRTTIATPGGPVPVDASWNLDLYDLKGNVTDAVQLSDLLAQSASVRTCLVRQFASHALGRRLTDEEACTTDGLNETWGPSEGSIIDLVRDVATWTRLRERAGGEAP